jgi:hypothetical protein
LDAWVIVAAAPDGALLGALAGGAVAEGGRVLGSDSVVGSADVVAAGAVDATVGVLGSLVSPGAGVFTALTKLPSARGADPVFSVRLMNDLPVQDQSHKAD